MQKMRALIKLILTIAAFFGSTFVLIRMTGLFTVEDIKQWLNMANELNPIYLFIVIVVLLFSDLFIAVPTLTITLLSGYFLGFEYGAIASISGMLLAGFVGYFLSKRFGERILKKIIKSDNKRQEVISDFEKYGFTMILLSRISPILPEVSACLAGMTKMKFKKFALGWSLNTIPYALIISYSGSISSLSDPKPAIYTIIGLYAFLSIAWYVTKKVV
jgi:uncharacterized membrane protein YdjX (TVP38/TMEM64 family)